MATTKPTLLVWDTCGEAPLAFYLIPDAPEWLKDCHENYLGNTDEIPNTHRVYDATCETPGYYDNADDPLAGKWVKYKLDIGAAQPHMLGSVEIVVSGFCP